MSRKLSRFEGFMVGIVVTGFLSWCNAEGANWYKVGKVSGRTQVFVDTDSIKRMEGDIVKAWTRELHVTPQSVGDEELVEVRSHNEFRCGRDQSRPTEVIYSYRSGKTERITSEGMKSWKTVNRESTKLLYEYLCRERK